MINCLIIAVVPGTPMDGSTQMFVFARLVAMFIIMAFSPTPGGAGLAEVALSNFISDYVPLGIGLVVALLWRGMAYYGYLIAGAIVVPAWINTVLKKKNASASSNEKVITPVGSNKEIKIDVRVIAATNKNLQVEIAQGRFREDLYHRINRIEIYSPSLGERKEDILMLAEFFLNKHQPLAKFSEAAKKSLISHKWIGNIRELENTVERAVIMARGSRRHYISSEHLTLNSGYSRPNKESIFVPTELLPKTESAITANALQNCIDWIERLFLARSLEILRDDNQAVYTRVEMSKANYFRRKKAIGLIPDQEPVAEVVT
jgi:hypothetical protein